MFYVLIATTIIFIVSLALVLDASFFAFLGVGVAAVFVAAIVFISH